jgi:hypothetical protein
MRRHMSTDIVADIGPLLLPPSLNHNHHHNQLDLAGEGVAVFFSEVEDEYSKWFSELNNAAQT